MTSEFGWDDSVDVLIAGSGAGGLGAAVVAANEGAEVLVVEKAPTVGGTTFKSAGAAWVPNNRWLREAGVEDSRSGALQYMARLSRPLLYDPDALHLGLPDWEYDLLEAFYDRAGDAFTELEGLGAIAYRQAPDFPDYYAQLPENRVPTGRMLFPTAANGGPQGGEVLVGELLAAAHRLGVEVRTAAPVTEILTDDDGTVIGVIAGDRRIRAARGVLFATGGFIHDPALRVRFLDRTYAGGCAVRTNTGDFLRLAKRVGADIANLNVAMRAPMLLERLRREPDAVRGSFVIPGDAIIMVNRFGLRVASEKKSYHDLCRSFFDWDSQTASYPNIPLIGIWDAGVAENFAGEGFGTPVPLPDTDDYWVVRGDDLDALARNIASRVEEVCGVALAEDFAERLRWTIDRFGRFAETGVDEDFHRGEVPIEVALSSAFGLGDGPNPTMRALHPEGPYFAALFGPGVLDSAGGPRADRDGRIFDDDGAPIQGLYGVGNCVANPSGEAYFAGGHTLGYILTAAVAAGRSAARNVPPVTSAPETLTHR